MLLALGAAVALMARMAAGAAAAASEPCVIFNWTAPSPDWNFHYQLGATIKRLPEDLQPAKANVKGYGIDGFDTSENVVQAMLAAGLYPVCYVSGGSWEDWRPDADDFPETVLGLQLDGWEGERWLDIRAPELRDIMAARIAMCAEKGFPAIDFDNVDGYTNPTGFPDISADDQIQYLTFLSDASHAAGLAVGLKNNVEQIPDLVNLFDFAINEECWQYDECNVYDVFVSAGKAVWNIEYNIGNKKLLNKICPKAAKLGIKTIKAKYALKQVGRIPCPDA